MIMTCDFTELLCVEAHQMKRIYEVAGVTSTCPHHFHILPEQTHRDVMNRLFHNTPDTPDAAKAEEVSDTPPEGEESELTAAGATLVQIIKEHFSDLMTDQRVNMFTYKNCCSGKHLVDWVISQSSTTRSRSLVVGMWQALLTEGVLQHGKLCPSFWCVMKTCLFLTAVLKEHQFKDDPQIYYQFFEPRRKRAATTKPSSSSSLSQDMAAMKRVRSGSSADRGSRSSVSSLLDECFDTIAHLGPEALLYAVLAKR